MSALSIVIVNYNVKHFLSRCLDSIYASKTDFPIEIYVVDNDSVDGSVEMIRADYPDVHLIASKENLGFSKGNNLALRQIQTPHCLLLNPDTLIEEDTLQVCHDFMEKHDNIGAIGVKMIDGSGRFLPESKRALPSLWNSLTKLTGLAGLFPTSSIWNGYALGHLSENETHQVEVLCGAFMYMPTDLIQRIGLLDERFFMYGEDIDLSYRIIKSGHTIYYLPTTQIIHYKGESTKKTSFNYVKTFYGAMALYVDKHYTGIHGSILAVLIKMAIVFRGGLAYLTRLLLAGIKPLLDALLIAGSMYGVSKLLATHYHHDAQHFDSRLLVQTLAITAIVWAFSLFFVGYYQKPIWRKRIEGLLLGTGFVLALYGLLPEELRSSRLLIASSAIIMPLVSWISSLVYWRKPKADKSNMLIVASMGQAESIQEKLDAYGIEYHLHGIISPDDSSHNADHTQTIEALPEMVRVLPIDEVIFSADDMPIKKIMSYMMQLGSQVSIKIAGDQSLSIIGSTSKNKAGELYSLDISFNLADSYSRHIKRSIDIFLGVTSLLLSPILAVLSGKNVGIILLHGLKILFGMETAVGYSGDASDKENLPELAPAWIEVGAENLSSRKANYAYAKDYRGWDDIEYFFTNFKNL